MPISTRLSKFFNEANIIFTYELEDVQFDNDISDPFEKTDSYLSFNHRPSLPFNLNFKIAFEMDKLKKIFPTGESSELKSRFNVVVEIESYSSRKIEILALDFDDQSVALDSTCTFIGTISIDPSIWIDEISLKAYIVRAIDTSFEPAYLTKTGHILGQSTQKKIYIDSRSNKEGSGDLDVRVDSTEFEAHEDNILYKLVDMDRAIAINGENDPELNTLFTSKTASGKLLNAKRALFSPIAADITEQLARKAFAKMLNDDYENPTVIALESNDFPYASVADDIARALSPGEPIEDALDHLINLLESHDSRDTLINTKLPLIVQHISKRTIKDCYKLAAKDAIYIHNRVRNNDQNT